MGESLVGCVSRWVIRCTNEEIKGDITESFIESLPLSDDDEGVGMDVWTPRLSF